MFPGISNNRWDYNIYDEIITKNGGTLLEGADAVITVEGCDDFGYYEIPLLAIEFSSALPAGNNSWQRSGRALSFSQANIPYIYSTEIGGIELDSKGNKKSVRWPSSALILSYILNSKRNNTISLIHYSFSPVADSNICSDYSFLNDNSTIFELIYKGIKNHQLLLSDATNILKTDEEIYLKRAKKTENYKIINGNFDADQVITGTKNQKLTWKKKVSIPTSDSFSALNKLLEKYCYSFYAAHSLPFGLLPKERIDEFLLEFSNIYPEAIVESFSSTILNQKDDVVFALINGYKPTGEDSRPDRGIIPFIRMLIGSNIPIISVIFGPIRESHIKYLEKDNLENLAKQNGLFAAILRNSDFMIIDPPKTSSQVPFHYYLKPYNTSTDDNRIQNFIRVPLSHLPKKIGEQDVDTLIHILFKYGFDNIFESFSNPPGGDWSGISIIKDDIEYRWLSLPRAPKNVKRPDHIFQLDKNTLLSIESKDFYNTLMKKEKNVGPQMNRYLSDKLFSRPVNAKRDTNSTTVFEVFDQIVNFNHFSQLTAASFIVKNDTEITHTALEKLLKQTSTDIVFGIKVQSESAIDVYFYSKNKMLSDLFNVENKIVKIHEVKNI